MNEKELKTVIITNSFEAFCYKVCRKWDRTKLMQDLFLSWENYQDICIDTLIQLEKKQFIQEKKKRTENLWTHVFEQEKEGEFQCRKEEYDLLSTGSSSIVIGGNPWDNGKDTSKFVCVTIGVSYDCLYFPGEMASEVRHGGQKKKKGKKVLEI